MSKAAGNNAYNLGIKKIRLIYKQLINDLSVDG